MRDIAERSATAFVAGLVLTLLSSLRADVHAQALLPFEREVAISVTYQHFNLNGHFETDGSKTHDSVPSLAHLAIADVEYGLTDRVALNVRLPYVASRYTGGPENPIRADLERIVTELCPFTPRCQEFSSLDTGGYYATAQDFGFMLRYSLLQQGLLVTPLVAATIPSHDYRTVGEAAPGQNRRALHVGVNVGSLLDPLLPGGYVHVRYTYSFVEPLYDIPLDRSNAEFEVGYDVAPTFNVRALAAWQYTHGGLSWSEVYDPVFDADGHVRADANVGDVVTLLDHDRLLANRYWHVGGGATLVLTNALSLNGALITFVSGADSHYGVGASVGLTWKFLLAPPSSPSRRRAGPLGSAGSRAGPFGPAGR